MAVVAVVLIAGAVAAVELSGDEEGGGADETPMPSSSFADLPRIKGKPILEKSQRGEALDLLRTDPVAQDLLADRDYEVKNLGPWLERDRKNRARLVGAVVNVRFAEPNDFEMRTWRVVSYGEGGEGAEARIHYRSESIRFGVENVKSMMFDIDLEVGRVVGVSPSGEDIEYTPGEELQEQIDAAETRSD